ncbi:MAG: pyridoxamine 5'-phosphate oxidase [Alphaproteobacteria bacterium]
MTELGENAASGLTTGDFAGDADPFELFARWIADAKEAEPEDHNAMALATVEAGGMPNVRMVLLKDFDPSGFVFFTNLESKKGEELAATPNAALCFHWKSLRRQIRLRGPVTPVADAEADAYFESRHRLSRIGAWASKQSRPLESRFALEKAVAAVTARYPVGAIPRPPHWSGFRLDPVSMEFWSNGAFRLHDRVHFARTGEGPWTVTRLYP